MYRTLQCFHEIIMFHSFLRLSIITLEQKRLLVFCKIFISFLALTCVQCQLCKTQFALKFEISPLKVDIKSEKTHLRITILS